MKVAAPGKIILSGEHAVVYGFPALAMAVNRHVTVTITKESLPNTLLDLADMAHRSYLNTEALYRLKDKVKRKYHRFMRGEYSIKQVLQKPFELAQFAMSLFAENFQLALPPGLRIHVSSTIPVGCGMGSSAATILSVMQAVATYFNMSLSTDSLYQLALEAENMQHGHSSGLDVRVVLDGGCIFREANQDSKRAIPSVPLYLVNTGKPVTTTGQCVEKVAAHFQKTSIGNTFADVTRSMDQALQMQSSQALIYMIRENHRLLQTIGVVPEKVNQFILQVEEKNAAAKICGAGSVAGDNAGMVLIVGEDKIALGNLCERYGYQLLPICAETRGVHAA